MIEFDWPQVLEQRDGESLGLPGIQILHDFPLGDVLEDVSSGFAGGRELADFVLGMCPADKVPILILTRLLDVDQGYRDNSHCCGVVVNIDAYLKHVRAGLAASFLGAS